MPSLDSNQQKLLAAYFVLCVSEPPQRGERVAVEYIEDLSHLAHATGRYPSWPKTDRRYRPPSDHSRKVRASK